MEIAEVKQRIRAIRLPQRRLAEMASVEPNTVSRVLLGNIDPRHSTLSAMIRSVEAEERRLLTYLLTLYPYPQKTRPGETTP